MSNPYVAFAQMGRDGTWKQFRVRDDVAERQGYWALRADGSLTYVNPMDEAPSSGDRTRFNEDQTTRSPGVLGSIASGAADFAAGGLLGLFDWNPGDALAGRPDNGEDLSPEMRRAMRAYLKTTAGMDGAAVTNESVPAILQRVQEIKLGMYDEEDLYDALWSSWRTNADGANPRELGRSFLNLFSGKEVDRANEAIRRGAEMANVEAAGRGNPADFATPLDGVDPGDDVTAQITGAATGNQAAVKAGQQNLGGLGGKAAAATSGAGIGGSGGVGSTTAVPRAPGKGPGGVTVTPEILREFVDSDFSLAFNKALNGFRDAGAASMFMDWMTRQMGRFQGEYEGNIAEQALSGQVPTGGFTDFLARKGLLPSSDQSPAGTVDPLFSKFQAAQAKASGTTSSAGAAGGGGTPVAEGGSVPIQPSAGMSDGLTPNGLATIGGSQYDPVAMLVGS